MVVHHDKSFPPPLPPTIKRSPPPPARDGNSWDRWEEGGQSGQEGVLSITLLAGTCTILLRPVLARLDTLYTGPASEDGSCHMPIWQARTSSKLGQFWFTNEIRQYGKAGLGTGLLPKIRLFSRVAGAGNFLLFRLRANFGSGSGSYSYYYSYSGYSYSSLS